MQASTSYATQLSLGRSTPYGVQANHVPRKVQRIHTAKIQAKVFRFNTLQLGTAHAPGLDGPSYHRPAGTVARMGTDCRVLSDNSNPANGDSFPAVQADRLSKALEGARAGKRVEGRADLQASRQTRSQARQTRQTANLRADQTKRESTQGETMASTNSTNYAVSVALPKKAGVYEGRGGSLSTQIADVTIDTGIVTVDAVLYGRLSTQDGRPVMDHDLAVTRGVRFEPTAMVEINAAVEAAAKVNPFWAQMERKAYARLMSGQTQSKQKIGLAAFSEPDKPKLTTPATK